MTFLKIFFLWGELSRVDGRFCCPEKANNRLTQSRPSA